MIEFVIKHLKRLFIDWKFSDYFLSFPCRIIHDVELNDNWIDHSLVLENCKNRIQFVSNFIISFVVCFCCGARCVIRIISGKYCAWAAGKKWPQSHKERINQTQCITWHITLWGCNCSSISNCVCAVICLSRGDIYTLKNLLRTRLNYYYVAAKKLVFILVIMNVNWCWRFEIGDCWSGIWDWLLD